MKENYPTIDSAALQNLVHLFQMTISKTHTVNLRGLHNAMEQLKVLEGPKFALLYFVVPPDVYPVFANPTLVASGNHNALPNNVHMIVLELPLPGTGHKRKVSLYERVTGLLYADSVLFTLRVALGRHPMQRLLS